MAAPALGHPSLNADQVTAAYQQAFGRAPLPAELSSELENANKYGAQGILNTIAARTNNVPGSGQAGTATYGPTGPVNPAGRSTAALYQGQPMIPLAGLFISSTEPGVSSRAIAAEQTMPSHVGPPSGSVQMANGLFRGPDGKYYNADGTPAMTMLYGY